MSPFSWCLVQLTELAGWCIELEGNRYPSIVYIVAPNYELVMNKV